MINFNDPSIITAICGAIGAIAAITTAVVSLIKAHQVKVALEKAKQRETYCVCPKCKKKIPLSELSFYLPDGSKDNDLNGIPDPDAK